MLKIADSFTNISDENKHIINHSRKFLLFNKQQALIKKETGLLDVTIGTYEGAEACELIASFLLSQLSNKYNEKDIRLYRDNGLDLFKNKSDPQAERIKKDFQKSFRENALNNPIKWNLKIVNCLDVTLNFLNNSYKPFSKPNKRSATYIGNPSTHQLQSNKYLFQSSDGYQVFPQVRKFLTSLYIFTNKH